MFSSGISGTLAPTWVLLLECSVRVAFAENNNNTSAMQQSYDILSNGWSLTGWRHASRLFWRLQQLKLFWVRQRLSCFNRTSCRLLMLLWCACVVRSAQAWNDWFRESGLWFHLGKSLMVCLHHARRCRRRLRLLSARNSFCTFRTNEWQLYIQSSQQTTLTESRSYCESWKCFSLTSISKWCWELSWLHCMECRGHWQHWSSTSLVDCNSNKTRYYVRTN